jgi:hypothetical protein
MFYSLMLKPYQKRIMADVLGDGRWEGDKEISVTRKAGQGRVDPIFLKTGKGENQRRRIWREKKGKKEKKKKKKKSNAQITPFALKTSRQARGKGEGGHLWNHRIQQVHN